MNFFIIKLFATILTFTHLSVSAILAENEPKGQLKPIHGVPIVEVDLKIFKQCVTLNSYEECLFNVVDQIISSLIEECSIFSANQDKCVSEYSSDEFVEAIVSIIETNINSLSDQDKLALKYQIITPTLSDQGKLALKYQIITPNPKPQQNDDNSLRPIVIKNNYPLVLAGTPPRTPPPGPDGPSRSEDADEDDPLIINIPDTDWPWLDEGDSDDGY